jgi:hypothetical protein
MELWLCGCVENHGRKNGCYRIGLRWRSHGVRCNTKRTVRFDRVRTVRAGKSVGVNYLRGCEDNQRQDDQFRCQLAQRRAVILDCVIHK